MPKSTWNKRGRVEFDKGSRAGVLNQLTLAYDACRVLVYIVDMDERTRQYLLHRSAFSAIRSLPHTVRHRRHSMSLTTAAALYETQLRVGCKISRCGLRSSGCFREDGVVFSRSS